MSPRWRSRARAGSVVLLAVVAAAAGVMVRQRPVVVRAHVIQAGDVRREAFGTGTLESDATIVLAFTAPGRIVSLAVDEGEPVTDGGIVGSIDLASVAHERSVAAAGVSLATAAVVRADADIARATAAHQAAEVELTRARFLHDAGAVSRATLDAAQELADRTAAELGAARAARAQGQGSVAVARETVALHERRVDDAVLRSPVDGIVVRRHAEPGDVVGLGAPVLTIAATGTILARVWVDELHLSDLAEGQPAEVSLRGADRAPLPARVRRIAPEVDRQTHEVLVELELVGRPPRVAFGQRVDVRITLEARASVPRVPRSVCDLARGGCLVVREERIAEAPVTTGLVGTDHAEIASGLAVGDVVIDASALDDPAPVGRRARVGSP